MAILTWGWLLGYRPDEDDEDEEDDEEDEKPRKKIPDWARGKALYLQLASQVRTDPDEVFKPHLKTCTLDEVFKLQGGASPQT